MLSAMFELICTYVTTLLHSKGFAAEGKGKNHLKMDIVTFV